MSTTLEIAPRAPSSTQSSCCPETPVATAPPRTTPITAQLLPDTPATLDLHDVELLCGVER